MNIVPFHKNRYPKDKGVSILEMVIVVALSGTLLLIISLLMQRTGKTFQKGTDMLNAQVLEGSIVERLRNDIRKLKTVKECNDHLLIFSGFQNGKEIEVKYQFDEGRKALVRSDSSHPGFNFDFHGAGQIAECTFQPQPSLASFSFIHVSFRITTEEKKGSPATSLSFITQFYSPGSKQFFLDVKRN